MRINKIMSTSVIAMALTMGATFNAQALPQFSVNASVLGGSGTFYADSMTGTSSSLVTFDGSSKITGNGYTSFGSFTLDGSNVFGNTGLNSTYSLYAKFSYAGTLVSGVFGTPGSVFNITDLTYNIYGTQGKVKTVVANANNSITPSITSIKAAQLIGYGNLISGEGTVNSKGDSNLSLLTSYTNTDFGDSFFNVPNDFYQSSFSSISNNASGTIVNAKKGLVSFNGGVASTEFVRSVPEPGSLALIGFGLIGIAFANRRKVS